jgi:4-hydroxy-tetrahydrodipicolinate reductase
MLNILLSGCYGKLSRAVINYTAASSSIRIIAGIDPSQGARSTALSFPVFQGTATVDGVKPDVMLDCSLPAALPALLEYAIGAELPLVLAATGYGEAEFAMIDTAARRIPVFHSGNMSLGIHILKKLAKQTACALGETFDIEITEAHHSQKRDAPSGTAYILAQAVNDGLCTPRELVTSRSERQTMRPKEEIGVHSIRGGTIVGEHTVLFAGFDEVIELTHKAYSKGIFAVGCVSACQFLHGKPAGRYGMDDLVSQCM